MLKNGLLLLAMIASSAALTSYSHYHSDAHYHCQDFRNSSRRTMSFWYRGTQNVISGLSLRIPKEILDDDKVALSLDGLKRIWTEHRSQLLNAEKWYLTLSLVVIVCSVVFTLFYLFYCCCMMCCRRKSSEAEPSDHRTRRVLNGIIIALLVLNVFLLVMLYAGSLDVRDNASELPDNADRCLRDVGEYVKDTAKAVKHLLVTNFMEFYNMVEFIVDNTPTGAKADQTGKANVDPDKQAKDQIMAAMNELRDNLQSFFQDIDSFLHNAKEATDDNSDISTWVRPGRSLAVPQLDTDPTAPSDPLDGIDLKAIYEALVKYGSWVYLAMAIILTIVTALFALGVLFGCFGKLASDSGGGCCRKSYGSWPYRGSIVICVIFMTLFSIVTALSMHVGGGFRFYVCEPLEEPLARGDIIQLIDKFIQKPISKATAPLNVSVPSTTEVLRGCSVSQNQTFYTIFHMNYLFDKYAGQFRATLHELIANGTAGASGDGDQEATQMIQNVTAEADGYLDLVNVTLRTDVLSCAPVRELTAQSVSMTCGYILDPFNGIWFALVICILATILLAFVSTCASKAYRKYEYPTGPRVMEVFSAWDEPIVYESAEKPPTRPTRPRFRLLRRFNRRGGRAKEDGVEVWRL